MQTRSRAFGQLVLADAHARHGRPDEACATAQDVLDSTQSLGSVLVLRQLSDLTRLLEPYRGSATVVDFLPTLAETLRERLWLYRWLTQDGYGRSDD